MIKTVGLLGGTSWPSKITYYTRLNQEVQKKLGGYHSARILLKSIDYDPIKSLYTGDVSKITSLLQAEILDFMALKPDCLILCNVWLHKFYDFIIPALSLKIPFFHAVQVVEQKALSMGQKNVLLIGTNLTMEDGFFARRLERAGLSVTIPTLDERTEIQRIQSRLAEGEQNAEFLTSFQSILNTYNHLDAVVLACTELSLVIREENSPLPILDPITLQCRAALDFSLPPIQL
ncbi:MAG: aspartate/glutamate racemase family protein [Candidatus Nucleicultricaceae bacterium]